MFVTYTFVICSLKLLTYLLTYLYYNYNYNRDLFCAPPPLQTDGALHCHDVLTLKAVLNKKNVLRRLLKVSIEHVVVFSSDGSRFQAREAATENALSPSLRVVRRPVIYVCCFASVM